MVGNLPIGSLCRDTDIGRHCDPACVIIEGSCWIMDKSLLNSALFIPLWLILVISLSACSRDAASTSVPPTTTSGGLYATTIPSLAPTHIPTLKATTTPVPSPTRVPTFTPAPRTPAPTATLTPSPTPVPTPTPLPTVHPTAAAGPPSSFVQLPQDEGAHLSPVEWWYFNGHLTTGSGERYSYHFVTFQLVLPSGLTPRLAQLSWADHAADIHLTAEQAGLPLLQTTSGVFDLRLIDWSMSGNGEKYSLEFQAGEYTVELQATSQKPAVLHDGTGFVDLGIAGKTHYYSRTNLATSGVVSVAGNPRQVTGVTWMDHQWGDFSTMAIGWDWLSLNLDNGSEIMVSVVWEQQGHQPITAYGTYVPQDSEEVHLPGHDIALAPTGSWTSEATGAEYPMGWTLRIESLDIDLTLIPVMTDAEFAASSFIPVAYWEGAVVAEGVKGPASITGRGFVEMVGYDAREPTLPPATPIQP